MSWALSDQTYTAQGERVHRVCSYTFRSLNISNHRAGHRFLLHDRRESRLGHGLLHQQGERGQRRQALMGSGSTAEG
jgi:hypothetical protein